MDLDTNRIKMKSIDSQSVWNNVNTIYIKEEPITFEEDVISMKQELNNEIVHDNNQESYDPSDNLIAMKHESGGLNDNEEIQPEL